LKISRPLAAACVAALTASIVLAQSAGPRPIRDLEEGPVIVQGTVKGDATITGPLSGTRAVLVRTEARLTQTDGGHVGPKKGAKEQAVDFSVADETGSVKVFAKGARPEQLKWKADVWDQEVVRSGRKLTQDAQRAIRSMMGEPEAMGMFSSTGDVVVREAWVAPEQPVTVRGVYRKSPAPGIYATDTQLLVIDAPNRSAGGGSGGGVPGWAIGVGIAVVVVAALLFLRR